MTARTQMIKEDLAFYGRPNIPTRLAEAWIRLERAALDSLSRDQFRAAVGDAIYCIENAQAGLNESLCESMGM